MRNLGGQLTGRVVLVTGAAQGIGRVFAKACGEAGATVALADIDVEKARVVASEIVAAGGAARALFLDVAEETSVSGAVGSVIASEGRIDILINNAALFSAISVKPFHQLPLEEWDRVLRINVTGVFLCARAVVGHMKEAGFGRIINIASAAARMGRPNYLHYIASKGAVEAMTRSMARELGASGITVNAIAPGAIFTQVPRETVTDIQKQAIIAAQCIPRAGTPDDLCSTMLHLASPETAYVTGQTFIVDGGVLHG